MRTQLNLDSFGVMLFYLKTRARSNGCVEWVGQSSEGYGLFSRGGDEELAHRLMYRLERGPIPLGMLVCHACDNPICVNPPHLFLGTDLDNNHDMLQKGRSNHPFGSRSGNSKLTEVEVVEMRSTYVKSYGALKAMAEKYGITPENLSMILSRQTWRHV